MSRRSFVFTKNCLAIVLRERSSKSHTTVRKNLNIQKWDVYYHECQSGKQTSAKKPLFSQGERLKKNSYY